jgi:phenylalanyl-tRNA synthetase alpha subunit
VLSKGLRLRLKPAQKPHLVYAQRIEAYTRQGWTRLGYCGVISPLLLIEAGLDAATANGLAVTLDLDRCLALPASAAEAPKRLQDQYF